ncbi:hypothetical protein QVD17_00684 [Tagetes erecta]|uniref:Uncharacterized protein n=1 Tax=Tagetes erecta TaxID=13708 RepID=A0AAD8P770_TARER|nr:hypothetical protein QVD17_00684 [Tagetes erecta]
MQVACGVRLEFCGGGVQFWWLLSPIGLKQCVQKKRKRMTDKPFSVTAGGLYGGNGNGSDGGGPYSGYGYGDDDGGSKLWTWLWR